MNEANEPGSWDEDFSAAYVERLYSELKKRFHLAQLGDAPSRVASGEPTAFIRHDVDVSLARAVDFARMEKKWDVPSTYHVMIDSPLYDIRSKASIAHLAELAALGHEVGLHYDLMARKMGGASSTALENDIGEACKVMEDLSGQKVRSLSFHLPVQSLLRGPLTVAGRVSGYAADLLGWYLSDSRARWREGNPIDSLARPRGKILQILLHPIWWGEENLRPEIRLRDFVKELAAERNQPFHEVREITKRHILYEAADL